MDEWGNEYRFIEPSDSVFNCNNVPLDLAVFVCIFIQGNGLLAHDQLGTDYFFCLSSLLKILNQTKLIKPKYKLIDLYLWHEHNNEYLRTKKTGIKSISIVISEIESMNFTTSDIIDIRMVKRKDHNRMLHGLFRCLAILWNLINANIDRQFGEYNLFTYFFPALTEDAIDFLTDPRNRPVLSANLSQETKKRAKEEALRCFDNEKEKLFLQHTKTFKFNGTQFADFKLNTQEIPYQDYINELISLGVIERLMRMEFEFYKVNYPKLKYKPYDNFEIYLNRVLERGEYNQVMKDFIIDYDIIKNFKFRVKGSTKPVLSKIKC